MAQLDTGITVYDINKQGMDTYDPLDPIALNMKVSDMIKDIFARPASLTYWMLLSNENKDYTVFHFKNRDNKKQFQKDFIETLLNRGYVLDITLQPDDNYEIWIRDKKTKENRVYYFFNYEWGVVEI